MAFGDKGGRSTIGAREIALHLWSDKKEHERYQRERREGPTLTVTLEADYAEQFKKAGLTPPPGQVITMPKTSLDWMYSQQKRQEGNAALLIRLLKEGKITPGK